MATYATSDTIALSTSNAVKGMNFCSIWPIAKGLLAGVQAGVNNSTLTAAIAALTAAADAVCNCANVVSTSTDTVGSQARLASFGLQVPQNEQAFFAGLSDNELGVLAAIQREAAGAGIVKDFGGTVF